MHLCSVKQMDYELNKNNSYDYNASYIIHRFHRSADDL